MKWAKIGVFVFIEILRAVQRGWNAGRLDVKEARMREEFERANSDPEPPLDKRIAKR